MRTNQAIKKALAEDWPAKIVCLILATIVWYIIHQNVNSTPKRFEWPDPAAAAEARK